MFYLKSKNPGGPTAFLGTEYAVLKRVAPQRTKVQFKGSIICDVGCGVGGYGLNISKKAKSYVGLELNKNLLRQAKRNCLQRNNMDFINASAEYLPLKSGFADYVLLFEVLEHVDNDEECLNECNRIIKENHYLLMTCPNQFYPFETHGMIILGTKIENLFGIGIPFLSLLPRSIHDYLSRARIYNQKQLALMLNQKGFIVNHVDYILPVLDQMKASSSLLYSIRSSIRSIEAVLEVMPFLRCIGDHVMILASKNSKLIHIETK